MLYHLTHWQYISIYLLLFPHKIGYTLTTTVSLLEQQRKKTRMIISLGKGYYNHLLQNCYYEKDVLLNRYNAACIID